MLTYQDDAWYVLHLLDLFQVSFLAFVVDFLTVHLVMAQLMFFTFLLSVLHIVMFLFSECKGLEAVFER